MRVESNADLKNGGWLHRKDAKVREVYKKIQQQPDVVIDAAKLMKKYTDATKPEWIYKLAESLGVTPLSLIYLGAAWAGEHTAWAFPMFNWKREVIGIRLRKMDGSKFAVKGSKQGLFIPTMSFRGRHAYICEGPTDTAAAISLNLPAIGRPSCLGSVEDTVKFLRLSGASGAVLIVDNDDPGIKGAATLASMLPVDNCRVILPAKDMRQFVNNGGTALLLESIAKAVVWNRYAKRQ